MSSKVIVIKTQFEALHCWQLAPEQVSFLRFSHRHMFYVIVKWVVTHNDREKEFLLMKEKVDAFLQQLPYEDLSEEDFNRLTPPYPDLGRMSCEDITDRIHKEFPDACFVSVFEDNENGVEAHYD